MIKTTTAPELDPWYVAPIKNVLNAWLDYGMKVISVTRLGEIGESNFAVTIQNGKNVREHKAEESIRKAVRRTYLADGYNISAWEIRNYDDQ